MYGMNPQMMPQYPSSGMNSYNSYLSQLNQIQQPQPQALTWVTGIEGAKAYQMPANSTVSLFDKNDDLMYIKSTDGAGFPTIRTFKFYEETEKESKTISVDDYVSKTEFETFKKEVAEYVEQFIQQNAKSNKQKITINGITDELRKSRTNGSTDVSE